MNASAMNASAMRALHWVLRILMAGVFLFAAYSKLKQSYLVFAMTISSYQLVPDVVAEWVAWALPPFELLLGAMLLVGWKLRYTSFAAMGLMAAFFAILLLSYGRGLEIDCGCFGVGEPLSAYTLTRDGLLLAAAVALWLSTSPRWTTAKSPSATDPADSKSPAEGTA
jgi:uncharacterized membrane protein YphA (DoxX/SURF4 family)